MGIGGNFRVSRSTNNGPDRLLASWRGLERGVVVTWTGGMWSAVATASTGDDSHPTHPFGLQLMTTVGGRSDGSHVPSVGTEKRPLSETLFEIVS